MWFLGVAALRASGRHGGGRAGLRDRMRRAALLDRVASRRARAERTGGGSTGQCARRRDAGPRQRALARARVRRAPVHGRRRPHRVLRVRRPDPLRARRGWSAARGDAPRLSLRGRRRGGRWPDTVHRARRSLRAGRARQRHRDARPRARVRRNRVVRRRGLRRLSAPRPERATGLRRVGPSEHAVGRDHAPCRDRRRRRTLRRAHCRGWSQLAGRVGAGARVGRRRHAAISCRIAAGTGTSSGFGTAPWSR